MSQYFSKVFQRDNRRCVYCGRDMMVDFETFMMVEEDHLIPRSAGGADDEDNIVTSCAVCNRLKGAIVPTEGSRQAQIAEICAHVMARRAQRMADFFTWTHSPPDAPKKP